MLSFLIVLAVGAGGQPRATDNRIPNAEVISRVEAIIVMPEGAGSLASYDRSYTQAKFKGKNYLLGQMIDHRVVQELAADGKQPLPPPVRRVLMKDIAPAFDGGCAILTLTYELGSAEPPKVSCNPPGPK